MSMKRMIFVGLCALAAACCASLTVAAQERNMARLVDEDTTFVDVSLGLSGATGQLKDIYAPQTVLGGGLTASSRRRVDDVRLYGRFGYGYDYGLGSTWRGWVDPYSTPFMLADSIPGSLSLEKYSLQAGAGVPLAGGRWALGIDVAYDVALMAKHRDLRNKNTLMVFRVAPGVRWRPSSSFALGLDLGYERGTEKVEYSQESTSQEHVLFDIYGLWLCQANGFTSAENRRMKEDDRFYGDFQLDLDFGAVSLHNNLRGSWLRGVQGETGYNGLESGTSRSWTWSDGLVLQLGRAHVVEASATWSTMQGFRPLQRQELDPDSRIRIWKTYGDPVFCYFREYHAERLAYTWGTSWKLRAEVENWHAWHVYSEYPQHFRQKLGCLTPRIGVEIPLGNFVAEPSVGYARDYDSFTDVTELQLAAPLLRQWDYWDGDSYLASLGLRWMADGGRTYVRARYDFEASTSADADGYRHSLAVVVGFVF